MQSQIAGRIPRPRWNWTLSDPSKSASSKKRTPSSDGSSKVRVVPSSAMSVLQREKEVYQKKIDEQQIIIDLLKEKLRGSERRASGSVVRGLLSDRHSTEIRNSMDKRTEELKSLFDMRHRELDVN